MGEFRLPSEISEEEWPAPEVFTGEAKRLADEAAAEGLVLRVMGGMAIHLHSLDYKDLWQRLGRLGKKVFTDIDFVAYGKHRIKLLKFFEKQGYQINQRLLYHYGKTRQIYYGPKIPMVEIFYDKLSMNHEIDYAGRLEKDFPTLPPAELLLQKLQMVHMNEKDIKDAVVLVRAHPVGPGDENMINTEVLTGTLSGDWGFYHTSVENLGKIRDSLTRYDVLSDDDRKVVAERLDLLLAGLEEAPKSLKWKMRAKLGTKKKWYNEVDDWDVIENPAE
ncbi:MAG: hypothetical protein JW760_09365 [Spirochaetales bacterium]|nr:hypothetical protein [Spirochaetales bacterium]